MSAVVSITDNLHFMNGSLLKGERYAIVEQDKASRTLWLQHLDRSGQVFTGQKLPFSTECFTLFLNQGYFELSQGLDTPKNPDKVTIMQDT